ncbi:MAG: hypothetical protein ABIR02_08245 [Novosphingobium sp.]
MPPIAEIASDQFRRRQANAAALVAAGKLDRKAAEALLLPWLAIACRTGAVLPELEPLLGAFPVLFGRSLTEPERRAIGADELCTPARCAAQIATARDAALTVAHTPEALDRARDLVRLARHFNAPPIRSAPAAPQNSETKAA